MGMSAEVIAIGPFSQEVAGFLGYPAERFANTKEGATVTCRLFGIAEGSTVSRQFAELLGISDPWDFNQHQIDRTMINVAALEAFGKMYSDYQFDVQALTVLLKAGFSAHFRPEG